MKFREKLKNLRKDNNLTQDALAEKLFVSRALVTKWEIGRRYPSKEMMEKIAQLFNVSYGELVADEREAFESVAELGSVLAEENNTENEYPDQTDDIVIRKMADKITDFLRTLPVEERKIFLRRYYFYDSSEEIAAEFGKSTDEIRTELSELRQKLVRCFETEETK